MRLHLRLAALSIGIASTQAGAEAPSIEAEIALQSRWHPQSKSRPNQKDTDNSLSGLFELYWESEDRNHSLTVSPFARVAAEADSRSHMDIRELYWNGVFEEVEIRFGVSKVFWGKTEIQHLVDVINQDDNLENLDGEDKLGQPMLRLSYRVPQGEIIGFVLPYFRERAFVDTDVRLSLPLPISDKKPLYESHDEEKHVDWALRWQGYWGNLDFGLAHFSGTARDPQFMPQASGAESSAPTEIVPVYPLMEQSSLDAQLTVGGWLIKAEALYRDTAVLRATNDGTGFFNNHFSAATAGFEYTLYGLFESSADLGLLAEYLWDERGEEADTLFQNDLFLGGRLALNDIAGTAILAGAAVDLDTSSAFLNIEASTRIDGDTSIGIQARMFSNVDPSDAILYPIRNDDYLEIEITRFF